MLTVYLDSQDYSVLSGEKLTAEQASLKSQLLSYARDGRVKFMFSVLVVSEVAPTQEGAIGYAIRRGDFLSQLCDRNALVDTWALLETELKALAALSPSVLSPYALDGDWISGVELPEPFDVPRRAADALAEEFETMPMTRQQRRSLLRKLTKNGAARPELLTTLERLGRDSVANTICAKYPMKPQSADALRRYLSGSGSRDLAQKAFQESLRDPCWMMRWFASTPELAQPVARIVRGIGQELGHVGRELVDGAVAIRAGIQLGTLAEAEFDRIVKDSWIRITGKTQINWVHRLLSEYSLAPQRSLRAEDVETFCPGFSVVWNAWTSSLWLSVGGSRKELPSDSQFPDALHAIYAPYVDIFRADRFMAPHIRQQVQRHGTSVVSKLTELVPEIERRLAAVG